MPRGGKRPGAGAPMGNTNAFKTGKHSPRFRALAHAISLVPQLQDMALAHYRLQKRKERQARKIVQEQLIIALLEDPTKFNQVFRGLDQLQHLRLDPASGTFQIPNQSKETHNNQQQSKIFPFPRPRGKVRIGERT